jgi:heme exporter protein A
MTAVLALDNLACVRSERLLFKGLSLALLPGDAMWLTGPNGVGKSSLLRLIAGLLPLAGGQMNRAAALALADERLALDPERPLGKALAFWAPIDGADPGAVRRAMADMALESLAEVPVSMLSTGQRKRAVLARTIASGAQLWLLDEPGNGLDAASLDLLRSAIAAHRARGGAILFASHFDLGLPDQRALALGEAA